MLCNQRSIESGVDPTFLPQLYSNYLTVLWLNIVVKRVGCKKWKLCSWFNKKLDWFDMHIGGFQIKRRVTLEGLTWRRSAWEQQHADTAVTEAAGNPKRVWRLSHFVHAVLSFSTLLLRSLLQNFYSLFLLPCSNIKTFLNVLFELLIHEKLSWCGFGWLSPITCFSMEF